MICRAEATKVASLSRPSSAVQTYITARPIAPALGRQWSLEASPSTLMEPSGRRSLGPISLLEPEVGENHLYFDMPNVASKIRRKRIVQAFGLSGHVWVEQN